MQPKPYYQDDSVTLYHGDCLSILPTLPAKTVDLVCSDPPYGMKFCSNHGKNFSPMAGDEDTTVALAALRLSLRLLKSNRHVYYFGNYPELSSIPQLSNPVQLIWDKGLFGLGNLSCPWGTQHETINFQVFCGTAGKKEGRGILAAKMRKGSVLSIQRPNGVEVCRHPTEKPVRLMRILIESSSSFDDVVLDMFAGSGSTLVAAKLEGRKAIGIELEERFCEVIVKRLKENNG